MRIPDWLRLAIQASELDATFAAGAAFAVLDAHVRETRFSAQAWRYRLALGAAATACRKTGRPEDEAALRDAFLLTRTGDDAGPAGRMLLGWRLLVSTPVDELASEDTLGSLIEMCGYRLDGRASDLGDLMKEATGIGQNPLAAAERVYRSVQRLWPEYEAVIAPWLCDAVVARVLGWSRAVPLFLIAGSARRDRAQGSYKPDRGADGSMIASRYACAALEAVDRAILLERRATRLLQVAPKLRAKGAQGIVQTLLADDALMASHAFSNMSDRGLRRLFARLVSLGAVRELSGRDSFRIYGL
ncbi:DUF1403 family protein [uncultured Nitratireductor sp.]|uniref:DUF1403 family protein n=1 Tax=uncultured Nitratireductor sp. TaxID=520953 RepID=UPI0025D7B56C|nr:DUF1403 family protein [uncultured Nitratireductor sp.]